MIPVPDDDLIWCKNAATCGETISPVRYILGYETCLKCGSPAKTRTVAVPYNKGAYQLIPETDIPFMGRK